MNLETLPVHYFSEFSRLDITNRMACFINYNWEACIYYCDTTKVKNDLTMKETWDCYKHFNISKSHYGLAQCDSLFPDKGMQYFDCIK
jgi:hypothetical protein